jgi:CheY-like chemotaxis protein
MVQLFLLASSGALGGMDQDEELVNEIRRKHLTILVVDDEEEFRESLCYRLKKKYLVEVDEVSSGTQAIAKVLQGNFYSLILSDIMMPGMKGTEVFEELRRHNPNIRIVLMSAYSSSVEWKKAEELGATLIHKPIDNQTLTKMLSQIPED